MVCMCMYTAAVCSILLVGGFNPGSFLSVYTEIKIYSTEEEEACLTLLGVFLLLLNPFVFRKE